MGLHRSCMSKLEKLVGLLRPDVVTSGTQNPNYGEMQQCQCYAGWISASGFWSAYFDTRTPTAITTRQPTTLYQRNEILVKRLAAKLAASPASTPLNAPFAPTRRKKNVSTNTPSNPP